MIWAFAIDMPIWSGECLCARLLPGLMTMLCSGELLVAQVCTFPPNRSGVESLGESVQRAKVNLQFLTDKVCIPPAGAWLEVTGKEQSTAMSGSRCLVRIRLSKTLKFSR